MEDTTGLASFLKAVSSEDLKFMMVGIASNVSDLLSDHQSLERRLVPVRLPLMKVEELGQIVTKAQEFLVDQGIVVTFTDEAILRLSTVAAGFPWFTHVLGQQALVDAESQGHLRITEEHINRAVREIVANRFAQQFADTYQQAVRDSEAREKALRAFAHWEDPDIPTGEIYRILRISLGVSGGSTYRAHLCSTKYGSILFVPRGIQKRGLVRFRNEMFKAYVRMRGSIFEGVDNEVAAALRPYADPN